MPGASNVSFCGGCKNAIKGDSVQCNVCSLWFEMKCSGVDTTTGTAPIVKTA